jgi:IPT/TIG domain
MLVSAGQAAAASRPLKTTCVPAWTGNSSPSKACAILWWDESTHEVSARCTLEYGFAGVATDVSSCELQQRKGTTVEIVAGVFPGNTDTTMANHTYTFNTPAAAPVLTDTYSVNLVEQPSLGDNNTGPQVTLATPFIHVLPMVTGVSPNIGSTAGGTVVTVTGVGFALGTTATIFKFGAELGRSVNCISTTECTVTSPAHAAAKVDVKATVSKVSSSKNRPGDLFTYF